MYAACISLSFNLAVVENSSICKFSRIYFIEFENKKKSPEIILLARARTIFINILVFMFYKYLIYILSPIFVFHN